MFLVLATLLAGVPAPQGAGPEAGGHLLVENASEHARREVVRASLPFARGAVRVADRVEVDGRVVPAVPLVRWPDGSVAVQQAHVPLELAAREQRRLTVRPAAPDAAAPAPEGDWLWPDRLPLHTEVEDPWGQVYTARLEADPVPSSLSSPLVRVQRLRGAHRREGAELLGLVAYLTTFRGSRRAELTLVLDNGAHLPDREALGPVRLRGFTLVTGSRRLRFRPRFAHENALQPPQPTADGFRQALLGPSDQLYLGDRTAKAFRLDLFWEDEEVGEEERSAAAAAAGTPLLAWPELDWVRRTGAFGAHGGPAPAGPDRSSARWLAWRRTASFGPFAGHGDPEDAAAQGTPRNGPSALHDVLRWRSAAMLDAAETMVLQQLLRPTPGTEPRLPAELVPFRQGLSPRSIERPHGFTAPDYEHFSVDLLYDFYWLTGDPLASAELERTGRGLRRVLAGLPFLTSRGEGWCTQAAVLIARATGDDALVGEVLRRAREVVLPAIAAAPSPVAIAQPPHDLAFGPGVRFDAPWQMAALVHGLHALYRQTGDAAVAAAAVRTARCMAGPGWLEGVGPKYLVSAQSASRYTMPVGFGPMEGTALHQVGAFVLAAEMTEERADRLLFARRERAIVDANRVAGDDLSADRWLQLHLDRAPGGR